MSNELGAGHPRAARLATRVVVLLALAVGVSEGVVMVLVRHLWGYAYSNEEEVVRYTARMMPLIAVSIVFDGLQSVLSGTLTCYSEQCAPYHNAPNAPCVQVLFGGVAAKRLAHTSTSQRTTSPASLQRSCLPLFAV